MPKGTPNSTQSPTNAAPEPDGGCAFILDLDSRATTGRTCCAASRRLGSAYCHGHHALCHVPSKSPAERRKMKEIEALAEAVGGRRGRPARRPPPHFLRRMDRISRAALRPNCSRIVLMAEEDLGDNQ